MKKKLEEAEAKTSEYKDSWLRSLGQFQNYRKRQERDNEMMYISMKGDIIKKFCLCLMTSSAPYKIVPLMIPGQVALNSSLVNSRISWKAKSQEDRGSRYRI